MNSGCELMFPSCHVEYYIFSVKIFDVAKPFGCNIDNEILDKMWPKKSPATRGGLVNLVAHDPMYDKLI